MEKSNSGNFDPTEVHEETKLQHASKRYQDSKHDSKNTLSPIGGTTASGETVEHRADHPTGMSNSEQRAINKSESKQKHYMGSKADESRSVQSVIAHQQEELAPESLEQQSSINANDDEQTHKE